MKSSKLLLGLLLLIVASLLALVLLTHRTQAQSNPSTDRTISFSARLRSASGTISPDGSYNVRFNLYSRADGGTPIWTEVYYDENGSAAGSDHRVQVKNGYLNVRLGSRAVFGSSVDWNDNLWLTMDIGGRTQEGNLSNIPWDGEMSPRIQLGAVPYALNAGSLGGRTADQFIQLGQGQQTNSSDNPSIYINTTGSGNLLQLQQNAQDAFTIDNSGNILLGSGGNRNIAIAQSGANIDGQTLTISGGSGGEGSTRGGNLVLTGGEGSQANGLVILNTTAFATTTDDSNCYTGGMLVADSCTISQTTVDSTSAAMIGFSTLDQTATLPDPTLTTPGRIIYLVVADDSTPFTLQANDNDSFSMQPRSAHSLLWNGNDWILIGDSGSSTPEIALPDGDPAISDDLIIEAGDGDGQAGTEGQSPPATDSGDDAKTSEPVPVGEAETTLDEEAVLGSMYYDTTLGKIQCYEADGWGPCSDAPDTFVTISPEYSNAVMNGTDIGVVSSDFCSGSLGINDGTNSQPAVCGPNETYNFYNWTSNEEEDQTRSIYLTYRLPDNFREFVANSTSVMGRTDSDEARVNYQVYRDSGSSLVACGGPVSVSSSAQMSWQRGSADGESDPVDCDLEPGDSILFRINLTAKNQANAYVSNVHFIFRNN